MATTMTLLELRTVSRQRADQVNSQFISDAELNSYINQSYFELYDILVQSYGDDYYVSNPVQFTTDGISATYALPDGALYAAAPALYKLLGVDLQLQAGVPGSYVTLNRFNFSQRNRYSIPNFQSFFGVTNLRYRLQGSNLLFTPIPMAGQTIQLWYIPRLTTLAADGNSVDGISGWTEYIIIDAAIKMMQKEESDTQVLMIQKQEMLKRIASAAANRDAGMASTVSDTQSNDFWWPGGSGSGNGSGGF